MLNKKLILRLSLINIFWSICFAQFPHTDTSINLMWVNRRLNESQSYIHPSKNETELYNNFLKHIFRWAAVSQSSVINVWFDSALTTPQAVDATRGLIKAYVGQHEGLTPIRLRDVREIQKVIQHPDVFSDKIPVFFRVDLLRPIVALHLLKERECSVFVYADLDMPPISKAELLDTDTMQKLQKYGMIMAHQVDNEDAYKSYENGFQIISDCKPNMLEAIECTIVELSIARAYKYLAGEFLGTGPRRSAESTMKGVFIESCYGSYSLTFEYFYHLERRGEIRVFQDRAHQDEYEVYDKSSHKLDCFGPDRFDTNYRCGFITQDITLLEGTASRFVKIPTKDVSLPPARIDHNDEDSVATASQRIRLTQQTKQAADSSFNRMAFAAGFIAAGVGGAGLTALAIKKLYKKKQKKWSEIKKTSQFSGQNAEDLPLIQSTK